MVAHVQRFITYDEAGEATGIDEVVSQVEPPPGSPEQVNRTAIRSYAAQALALNKTYLAIAAPTTAQTVQQVRLLTRETTALIRLVLTQLDATDLP